MAGEGIHPVASRSRGYQLLWVVVKCVGIQEDASLPGRALILLISTR